MGTTSNRPRLSGLRVLVAMLSVALLGWGGVVAVRQVLAYSVDREPWFAGYVDATLTPTYRFEAPVSPATKDVVLSFVVAAPDEECTPTWGGAYGLDQAATALDLDRRIQRLRDAGGDVVVSFGGLANDELATVCRDVDDLLEAYRSVVDRYDVSTVDFDVEGAGLASADGARRRAAAVAALQRERREDDRPLAVWLTLPVSPDGLTDDGVATLDAMLETDVDVAGVNAMTMNYADSRTGRSMLQASTDALGALHRQLDAVYRGHGVELDDASLWFKVGATPMIGQNDVPGEVFDLEEAAALRAFALEQGLGRLGMWSLNRDASCGPNYVDLARVSNTCSGIDQGKRSFAETLGNGLPGRPASAAERPAPTTTRAADPVDDPETSPYPVWSSAAAYPQGSKVVWHRQVYVAKWWAQGQVPDEPVVHEWDTPWQLVGPVMPGDRPVKPPVLPDGTYPEWSSTEIYTEGDRVQRDGVGYEAKWWTKGDRPDSEATGPGDSPWAVVTEAPESPAAP
jgi:chitinase